jgi:hypothetical protein
MNAEAEDNSVLRNLNRSKTISQKVQYSAKKILQYFDSYYRERIKIPIRKNSLSRQLTATREQNQ